MGLLVSSLRPADLSIDDDPMVPLYSVFAVVWAIFTVARWRSRQAELAFVWGTHPWNRSHALAKHSPTSLSSSPLHVPEHKWRRGEVSCGGAHGDI